MGLDHQDIYERYFDKVYKTVFYTVKDRELAKGAAQDTFIKAFKNINKLKDPTKKSGIMDRDHCHANDY